MCESSVCRGKIVPSSDIPLSHDCSIHALGAGDTYKYLGFDEAEVLDCAKTKGLLTNMHSTRLKLVWGSLLSGPPQDQGDKLFLRTNFV